MNRLLEALDWIAGTHGRPAINDDSSLGRTAYRTIEFRRGRTQRGCRPSQDDRGPDCDALALAR